jgi:8-oxo-dGTP diphosphatase
MKKDVFGREGKRPTVACDCVIFRTDKQQLELLLVKRGTKPYLGKYALPGGYMEWGESCERAAARELKEETGLENIELEQIGVFSEPGRDPRGTVVSIAYTGFAELKKKVKAGDDAAKAEWVPIQKCPKLAFDHGLMLRAALKKMFGKGCSCKE